MRGSIGPAKTILIGYKIVDTVLFHPVSDSVPRKDSPLSGMSRILIECYVINKEKGKPRTEEEGNKFFS